MPGDGDIPFDRILGPLLAAGYTGAFDLELIGPRIEAEGALRPCLAIRALKEPSAWTTSYAQALLGAALLEQQRYAEAEPLLKKGYEEMKQRPSPITASAPVPKIKG